MRTVIYIKFEESDEQLLQNILECDRLLTQFIKQWPKEQQGLYESVLAHVTGNGYHPFAKRHVHRLYELTMQLLDVARKEYTPGLVHNNNVCEIMRGKIVWIDKIWADVKIACRRA